MTTSWTPHEKLVTKQHDERSDKLESTAIEIGKLAVQSLNGQSVTDRQLVDRMELIWLWATSDNWPKPNGAP